MARTRTAPAVPTAVTITYDLFDLPTAQHKAGLAGLLFQIRHMEGKTPKPAAIPKVAATTATTATIEFTAESVQCLFDDLYATDVAVVRTKTEWDAKEAKPPEVVEEEVDDEDKDGKPIKKKVKIKYFFYHQDQPCGNALRQYITKEPESWLKLWRDMLWAIPRGNPQSRKPYKERAEGKSCGEGKDVWSELLKVEKARAGGEFHTGEVAGSLWLGAQAVNAESVAFEGRVEQTLLLHFWPLTAQVYTPQMVQPDGESKFVGYVLAIPEVADLGGFLEDYRRLLSNLSGDVRGFRPAEAVIDMPAEGALSFLDHLAQLSGEKATATDYNALAYNLGSVEFIHLAKIGNNIKTLAAGRVAPRPGLMHGYLRIVGKAGEKPPYANPLFRRGLMLALLDGVPWFKPFGKLFAEWDVSFFVPTDAPPKLKPFWDDARKKLQEFIMSEQHEGSSPTLSDSKLTEFIERIVKRFLLDKAKKRKNHDPKKKLAELTAEQRKEVYQEKRKVAQDAFYRARSRRGEEFVAFFTEEICSFGSYFDHKKAELQPFANALIDRDRTDAIKTITLLTLSANA
jgi:CRISPR-associated protein Cmx8